MLACLLLGRRFSSLAWLPGCHAECSWRISHGHQPHTRQLRRPSRAGTVIAPDPSPCTRSGPSRDVMELFACVAGRLCEQTWCGLGSLQMLGAVILLGACVVTLPQVAAVVRSRSVDGLSLASFEVENYAYCVHLAYGAHLSY
jgi:PQ loop repeat